MTPQISESPQEFLSNARMTAKAIMLDAIDTIDDCFEVGFAAKHPELVAVFMQAASLDVHGKIIAQQLRAGIEEAASAIAQGIWDGAKYMGDQQVEQV